MLQMKTAGFKALDNLRSTGHFPASWQGLGDLEEKVDNFVARFLIERFKVSKELGGGFLLPELLDSALRTSEKENMDELNVPEKEKLELVEALDRQNSMMQLYPRYISLLLPWIHEVAEREKREVKILELASGSGGLALALAEELNKKKLPVCITGSDIVPAFIEKGNELAEKNKLPLIFRHLDAFNLNQLGEEKFDLVLISQSLHHFTPGQLAVIIAQSAEHCTTAFIGIDGYRSILLACGVPLVSSLQGIGSFTMDGMTSARKFYSELELDIISEIATGKKNHAVYCSWPLSVLTVRFDHKKSNFNPSIPQQHNL
ncbi:MAG: class I SAM-dependent methyltransferase [Chlorobium sp.]|nr:MAG: class I SAM-dependent methyltransferase [Chlorobium sp.]